MTATLTKKQVQGLLNVSAGTLKNWLNVRYYKDLTQIGYRKEQKILTPLQVDYLRQKIGLDTSGND